VRHIKKIEQKFAVEGKIIYPFIIFDVLHYYTHTVVFRNYENSLFLINLCCCLGI